MSKLLKIGGHHFKVEESDVNPISEWENSITITTDINDDVKREVERLKQIFSPKALERVPFDNEFRKMQLISIIGICNNDVQCAIIELNYDTRNTNT